MQTADESGERFEDTGAERPAHVHSVPCRLVSGAIEQCGSAGDSLATRQSP